MSKVKILYIPNETEDVRQDGLRRPLADLVAAGLVADVSVFSLQLRQRRGGDAESHRQDLLHRVRQYQPDMVLMQHVGRTGLRKSHFKKMRAFADFELIYHEADPYSRFLHPLPSAAREAGRHSDVVFTVGEGVFAQNFRKSGSRDVRYAPSAFEPDRTPRLPLRDTREHDIVMIANRNTPRLRGLPNWKDRIAFVEAASDRFGERFAIYGNGWSGPSAQGPVDFSKQHEAIMSGWISANWDHFADEQSYFSNRLPISLASGSVHATTSHPGYENLFPQFTEEFLIQGRTIVELCDSIENYLLRTSTSKRLEDGVVAREFAYRNFRSDDLLVRMLNYRRAVVDLEAARQSWGSAARSLEDV